MGETVIASDPASATDNNGKQLLDLLDRQNLVLLNADERCEGKITRFRETTKGVEKSILDYMVVCKDMYKYFESLYIDEKRVFTLCNYTSKKNKKAIKSDHNPLFATFKIKYRKQMNKRSREEIFDLKDPEGQFHRFTQYSTTFHNCIGKDKPLEHCCKDFMVCLNSSLHRCFKKVRVINHPGKLKKKTPTDILLQEKY